MSENRRSQGGGGGFFDSHCSLIYVRSKLCDAAEQRIATSITSAAYSDAVDGIKRKPATAYHNRQHFHTLRVKYL